MAIKIEKKSHASAQAGTRYLLVALVLLVAFLGAYAYATSVRGSTANAAFASGTAQGQAGLAGGATSGVAGSCCGGGTGAGAGTASGATGAAGGCCGTGGSQKSVKGTATVSGGLQKVTVDLTTGSYSPNDITAKAGVPIELTFKGPASGCNGYVQSQQLGFSQDVSNGGTIKLPALQPGTYTWACSMNMYRAQIVVK